ncbi:MAG: hypothetical protein ACRBF0_17760 [Calditrichia bacterium]
MKWLLTIFLLTFSLPVLGQEPVTIAPGKTKQVTAGGETLVVVPISEIRKAISESKKVEISDSMIALLHKKSMMLNQVISEKDSIIVLNRMGYERYLALWEKDSAKLEDAEVRIEDLKRSRFMTGFYSLLAGAAVVGIFSAL